MRRETISGYDAARQAHPAKTFLGSSPRPRFAAARYRTAITEKLDAGLSMLRIWQDLVEEYGFDSLDAQNAFLQHWNRTIVRLRIHGTTRRQVWTHFVEVEQPALHRSPARRFGPPWTQRTRPHG